MLLHISNDLAKKIQKNDSSFIDIPLKHLEGYGFEPQLFLDTYEFPNKFPFCCKSHENVYLDLMEWYIIFPMCCQGHKDLASNQWFEKRKYDYIVIRILRCYLLTIEFIKKVSNEYNFEEEIQDYITYCIRSFGTQPLGFDKYLRLLNTSLSNYENIGLENISKNKIKFIKEYTETCLNVQDIRESFILPEVANSFQKWLSTIPDLEEFKKFKEKNRNVLPINLLIKNVHYNRFLNTSFGRIKTQKEFVFDLIQLTKQLLMNIDTSDISIISPNQRNKNFLELIAAKHRVNQLKLLEDYNKYENKYLVIFKKWIKNELQFLKNLKKHNSLDMTKFNINAENVNIFNNESGTQHIIESANFVKEIISEDVLIQLNNLLKELGQLKEIELEEETSNLKIELNKSRPNSTILKRSLTTILEIMKNVAVESITPSIIENIEIIKKSLNL